MWNQLSFNEFKNGENIIKIDCFDTGNYLIWKNEEYVTDLDSFEKVQGYLEKHDIGKIILPTMDVEENRWHSFGGNEHYEEIITRKISNDILQSVIICHYESNSDYGVLMRSCGYDWIEWLVKVSFEFVEEKGRVAENILELDAYEAGTHGSSGREECHYDFKTRKEVDEFIKEKYGIQL